MLKRRGKENHEQNRLFRVVILILLGCTYCCAIVEACVVESKSNIQYIIMAVAVYDNFCPFGCE